MNKNEKLESIKDKQQKKPNFQNEYGIKSYMINRDDVIYRVEPGYDVIVDKYVYEEYIGSFQLYHKEPSKYVTVTGYIGDTESLDLTFIKPQDFINLKLEEEIKSIKVNFTNLENMKISKKTPVRFDIVLDYNILKALGTLKNFLDYHSDLIDTINFQGIENNNVKDLLIEVCSKYGKKVTTIDEVKEKTMDDEEER